MALRRSCLFMPAHNERAIAKAQQMAVDAVILDLEDAVAPHTKAHARETARAALITATWGYRACLIRVNGTETAWHVDDLTAFADAPIDGIVLPKAETHAQIAAVGEAMDRLNYPASVALWVMAETPEGVLNAHTFKGAHPRVSALVMGTSDLAKCLRTPPHPDRLGLTWALSQCVMAARAQQLTVLDGVCLNLNDAQRLDRECAQGRALGFDGKTLIHPSQIDAAHRHFSPSPEAIDRATRIVDTWAAAQQAGEGLCVLDGRLVESLHVEDAERILADAQAIAERDA